MRPPPVTGLELKVPPDIVAVVIGSAMWLVSRTTQPIDVLGSARVPLGGLLLVLGWVLIVMARTAFSRAGTTFSPIAPDRTSALVTTGVYRFTRNPMYVGMAMVLLSLGVLLASMYSLLLPVVFVLYIDRYQIAPEERLLASRFGEEYRDYAGRVRRWA